MKINRTLLLATVIAVTATKTNAQTSFKPAAYIVHDTAKHAQALIDSFDVEIIPQNENQSFILSISNPFAEKLSISISSNSSAGFNDQTKQMHYRKRVNMEAAEDGNYTINVCGEKRKFSKTLTLQTITRVDRSLSIQ